MRWLDEAALRRLGASAFLAVAAANEEPARHRPPALSPGARERRGAPDVALVGKGILFDTGGINLKPHKSMLDMHTDMSGSAVALATLVALAELTRAHRGRTRGSRSPRTTSGRTATGRRKSCAPRTASRSR